MTDTFRYSRRSLIGTSLALAPAVLLPAVLHPGRALARAACALTADSGEGPFYPHRFGRPGNDLFLSGGLPDGEPILVAGVVLDGKCRPLAGVAVEIWQADRRGQYRVNRGAGGSYDPHFAYWGRALTGTDGGYRFRTILPSSYGTGTFSRTRHIHFKVWRGNRELLTTQMYFPGEPKNANDFLFNQVPAAERHTVIAVEEKSGGTGQPTPFRFDIAVV